MTTTKSLCLTGGAHVMYCIAAVLLALLLPVQTMADEAWVEYNSNDSTLTFKYGSKPESFNEVITAYVLNTGTDTPGWNDEALNIKSVVFDASFASARPTSCYAWFKNCVNLTSLDLTNLNTEAVTNMSWMFGIDEGIFYQYHISLKSITWSENFNTANVTDMNNMFAGCYDLTSLNVSGFNTANVCDMNCMFADCSELTTLNVSSFNTANVMRMDGMFGGCSKLATVYVGEKFFIKTTKEPLGMFDGCAEEGAEYYYLKTYYRVGNTMYELWSESEAFSVDELVLEDGKDFVAHAPFTAATASYTRTMANRWGTLCLPFAVETSAATGCTFYGLESVTDDLITLTLLDGTIEAGTPVFVNSSSGSISVSASNADVVTSPAAGTESGWQLVGSYTVTDVPDNGYIISNNKFWLASDLKNGSTSAAVKTKGLRAWLKAGSTGSESRANTLDIFADETRDDVTSIDVMEGLDDGTAEIYDTQGRRTDRLQKGLNIVKTGGTTKKVMVK